MTDCTSASALTGGSTGGASLAPAGLAISTNPATPAAVPAAATVSAVLFLSIALSPVRVVVPAPRTLRHGR
ncbi:hypothetical protein Aglo01_55290 [Actinokineospora globicatena]|nr:hypothetical protein Aglo01_55290 [Actinokineospora globicatena]GLW88241.1 hypothetical protein Aglo02_58800 [Actinokineospora globicatena]